MICCLQGRIGNQMFQYAMAKAAAIRLNCDLKFNIERLKNVPLSSYNLCLWKGVNLEITEEEGNRYTKIIEGDMPYNQNLVDRITCNSALLGYWQTEKYFSEIKDILKNDFIPREPLTKK